MIRVAVILAAIAQAPLLGLSTVAQAQQTRKQVSDSYYAKRAQAKLEAAVGLDGVSADVENLGAGPAAVGPRPGKGDPYYAARQAAMSNPIAPVGMYDPDSVDGQIIDERDEIVGSGIPGETGDAGVENYEQVPPVNPNGDYSMHQSGGLVDTYNEYVGCGTAEPHSVLWDEIHSCRTYWVTADYLAWGFKGNHVPALVTTSPNGTPQNVAGILGEPTTSVLFGDNRILTGIRSGGRITAGAWIVGDIVGIEANYMTFGTQESNLQAEGIFSGGGAGPILARPFTAPPNTPSRVMLAFPNFVLASGAPANLDGFVRITGHSNLQSAGVDLKRMAAIDFCGDKRLFLTGGYRYLQLNEDLAIYDRITTNLTQLPLVGVTTHFDQFRTFNQFNGGTVGLTSDIRRGRWVLESQAKVALGNMRQTVEVDGNTTLKVNNGPTQVFTGGVLTQQSNIGRFTRNQFAAIPEFNFKLGYQLSCNWRATVGYNFTWISRVARPGNQIDTLVSIPPVAGGAQPVATPVYLNNPTSIWMQGITTGLEYRF
jgi:hypothetical protein